MSAAHANFKVIRTSSPLLLLILLPLVLLALALFAVFMIGSALLPRRASLPRPEPQPRPKIDASGAIEADFERLPTS
ncbi:MAG: hypothetical protein HY075_15365 [Deltaproteobacteria bacterium]|nr:hypothetical protein [Deltaproteobacteria bacterium]